MDLVQASRFGFLLFAAFQLTGCFAGPVTVAPALRGRVLDADTRLPIAGATVIRPCHSPEDKKITDENGRFSFIRSTGGSVLILGNIHPDDGKSSLGVSSEGFGSCCMQLVVNRGSSAETDVGNILLEPGGASGAQTACAAIRP